MPKIVNREEKIKAIAAAALELFAQKGFGATSVGQIARKAGVGKGTLYDYFDTKTDIIVAAIGEWVWQMERDFEKKLSGIQDPVRRLTVFADLSADLVDPIDPATARLSIEILQHTMLQDGLLFGRRHLMKDMHNGMRRIVVNILLDGISKGVFRPEIARDAEKIAINFLGYLDGISLHSIMSDNDFDIKEQIEFSLESIVRLIRKKSDAEPARATDVFIYDNEHLQ
jgi:AcrR family transcriptional regulator